MQEVVASVQRVTDIMSEITAASQEQTSGIEQINQAITQMDETTQQNAALVEESAAAAEALQDQAAKLAEIVNVFKLDQFAESDAPVATPDPVEAPAVTNIVSPLRMPVPKGGTSVIAPRSKLAATVRTGTDDWMEF